MFKKIEQLFAKYPLPAIVIVTLALFAGVLVITAINLNPTAEVEVLVAPASATVEINGKKYQNGTYRLPKGQLSVKITKDGFKTKEYTFDTSSSDKLYDFLTQNDGTLSWYLEHEDDALILTKIGDSEASALAESYNAANPIISVLPVIVAGYDTDDNYVEYRIDGGSFENCDAKFCLKVTDTTGDNIDNAREKIRELGFSPDDYQILYEYTPITPLE